MSDLRLHSPGLDEVPPFNPLDSSPSELVAGSLHRPGTPYPTAFDDTQYYEQSQPVYLHGDVAEGTQSSDQILDQVPEGPPQSPSTEIPQSNPPSPGPPNTYRIHLAHTRYAKDRTNLYFPSPSNACPFRLFDCKRFVDTGELDVVEFSQDFLAATVETDIKSVKNMEEWSSQATQWVAVSYDMFQTYPSWEDGDPGHMFRLVPSSEYIRSDVLRLLCLMVLHQYGVRYLWLDKLCVFRDGISDSSVEVCRWSMPGNIKRVFGCANGILVLVNGLCRPPPLLEMGETLVSPGFGFSLDFRLSLRFFLEMAFSRCLEGVHVLVQCNPDFVEVSWIDFEAGIESGRLEICKYMAGMQTGTIRFEDFLQAAHAGMLQLRPCERGSGIKWRFLLVRTFEIPSKRKLLDNEPRNRPRLAKTLLSMLRSRERLRNPEARMTNADRERMLGDWQVAIWYNILSRRTKSCSQFILGLVWLLQDFYEAEQRKWTYTGTFIQKPSTDALGIEWPGVSVDLDLEEMEPIGGASSSFPSVDIVAWFMSCARERLDGVTGMADLTVPFIQSLLPLIVDKVNVLCAVSDELSAALKGCFWEVYLPSEWILARDASGSDASAAGSQTEALFSFNRDHDPPDIGKLELFISRNQTPYPLLSLQLRGLAVLKQGSKIFRDHHTRNTIIKHQGVQTELIRVPAKIWRSEQNQREYWVEYLELQFDKDLRRWQPLRYCPDPKDWNLVDTRFSVFLLTKTPWIVSDQ